MIDIPDFNTEAEEAAWWDAHQEEVAAEIECANAEGTLGIGTVAKKAGKQ